MQNHVQLTILIVDDHPIFRQGLFQFLCAEFPSAEVLQASTAREALALLQKKVCNLVILDITLPDRSGLEVLKEVKQIQKDISVLILTFHSEEQFAVRALRVGADGYLTKESTHGILKEAIQRITAGHKYITPSLGEKLALELGHDPSRPPHELLSDRELGVLQRIAQGETISSIAIELNLSVNTVNTYRFRVLEKLQFKNNAELIKYAIQNRLVE